MTRKDVADKAGVSSATVSHVINNSKYVSPVLRGRVEQAIEALNYIPNRTARNLALKKTDQVGIVVPSLSNPYYGEIAEGMEAVARQHDYIVSLVAPEGNDDRYVASIIERQMDGIFLATFGFTFKESQLRHMANSGVRIVTAEKIPYIDNAVIRVDYEQAILKTIRYLSELGHKRIAFLSGMPPGMEEGRKTAYLMGLKINGLDDDPSLVIPGNYPFGTTARDGYMDMKRFLTTGSRPEISAIFAINDLMAIGALKAIREAGLEVPRDISLVGCDDIFLAEAVDPPLTTIHTPKARMGQLAMELLLAMIESNVSHEVSVETELVIRESTSKAP